MTESSIAAPTQCLPNAETENAKMRELRQGGRRYKLNDVTETTVTLAKKANVKPGPAYLIHTQDQAYVRRNVEVTGQDGLVVSYERAKMGRPLKVALDVDKLRALQAGGMTQAEIADRFGVTLRTIQRKLGGGRKRKGKKSK